MRRSSAWARVALFTSVLTGCTDATQPGDSRRVSLEVEATVPLTALVLELTGVSALEIEDGRVLQRADGPLLRAVVLLDEPGTADLVATLADETVSPTVRVVEAADADEAPVADPTGVAARFGS